METRHCDYLIVGGGAAGSVLGYLLRKAGADVLILERLDAKQKDKLCAGMVTDFDLGEITKIFGEEALSALDAEPISVVESFFGGYELISRGEAFYTMPRKRLDDYFLNSYLKLGGQIKDRATVRKINLETNLAECVELRTKKFFHVQFGNLIGADGATSTVRKLTTGKSQKEIFDLAKKIGILPKKDAEGNENGK